MAACGGPGAKGKRQPTRSGRNQGRTRIHGHQQCDNRPPASRRKGRLLRDLRMAGHVYVGAATAKTTGPRMDDRQRRDQIQRFGGGEAQDGDGGDLIFTHKFKNFELEVEWKVAATQCTPLPRPGGSHDQTADGAHLQSPPRVPGTRQREYSDANWASTATRKSASLYDMIPAVPPRTPSHGE